MCDNFLKRKTVAVVVEQLNRGLIVIFGICVGAKEVNVFTAQDRAGCNPERRQDSGRGSKLSLIMRKLGAAH